MPIRVTCPGYRKTHLVPVVEKRYRGAIVREAKKLAGGGHPR